MTKFLRFDDLRERGVLANRTTLANWTKHEGFPPGRLLSPSCRVWTEDEVERWLASRPATRERRRAAS